MTGRMLYIEAVVRWVLISLIVNRYAATVVEASQALTLRVCYLDDKRWVAR